MTCPRSWYYACSESDLARGPVQVRLGRDEYAVFRSGSGRVSALGGRCVHLGANLSRGCVIGENLQCPFHEWQFAGDGRCVHIPASETIPDFARQTSFPVAVRGGHVFLFNRPQAPFEAPFFAGKDPGDLFPARAFTLDVGLRWDMVAANGFDLQHFRAAHDRTLLGEPTVEQMSPFARTLRATFSVSGHGIRDRLTRRVSGPQVAMSITVWCGTMSLVTAEFQRTTSYGMVCITPIDSARSRLTTIVWVPRSRSALGRALFDPLDAAVRRSFIMAFMKSDQHRAEGIRYTPGTLIAADAVLVDYFQWLESITGGESSLP